MSSGPILNFNAKKPPTTLVLGGLSFRLSSGINKPGVVAHYREDRPTDSAHLYVRESTSGYTWEIDHRDAWNPDYFFARHLLVDVLGM